MTVRFWSPENYGIFPFNAFDSWADNLSVFALKEDRSFRMSDNGEIPAIVDFHSFGQFFSLRTASVLFAFQVAVWDQGICGLKIFEHIVERCISPDHKTLRSKKWTLSIENHGIRLLILEFAFRQRILFHSINNSAKL